MDRGRLTTLIAELYGSQHAGGIFERLEALLTARRDRLPPRQPHALTEADAVLIAYPDQVQAAGEPPLRTLARLADRYLADLINTLHVLPFFPSSSDDGFSVTDYEAVDAAYGDWADIKRLGAHFGLVFDAVINHASAQGGWFQGFLRNDKDFSDHFIEVQGNPDLGSVVRPRTLPLVTSFASPHGTRSVWTTFSADQVDLNYRNPEVLLRVLDILLLYVERGARIIRLDAVGYIWKELGTACIHLPQAHAIVRLMREALRAVAPHVLLLTETNVPQGENLSYLGDGHSEADLAYNFALPPLMLHTFHTAQAATLNDWVDGMPRLPAGTALVNILATHDGIGLNGAREFLTRSELEDLARRVELAGGFISRRSKPGGGADAYELNINYLDAMDAVAAGADSELAVRRFVTAHAIMLALQGMPALYFHSLFGSRGWPAGVQLTGRHRSINRERLTFETLNAELQDSGSARACVHLGLAALLSARRKCPAFSPLAPQRALRASEGVFALLRGEDALLGQVLCVHNVTAQAQRFDCSPWIASENISAVTDLITSRRVEIGPGEPLRLAPYSSFWLRIESGVDHSWDPARRTGPAWSDDRESPQ